MEMWDEDYSNLEVQANIGINEKKLGNFQSARPAVILMEKWPIIAVKKSWNLLGKGKIKMIQFWEVGSQMLEMRITLGKG
jgi:hypothetical protein